MAERLQLPADVVGPGAGFHANQALGDIGQSLGELGAGKFEAQHTGSWRRLEP
jgi:hypothetical protein